MFPEYVVINFFDDIDIANLLIFEHFFKEVEESGAIVRVVVLSEVVKFLKVIWKIDCILRSRQNEKFTDLAWLIDCLLYVDIDWLYDLSVRMLFR